MVKNGDTGDLACDHYHRMPDDVALMRRLGVERVPVLHLVVAGAARRLGPGQQQGVDFYRRLVDELLGARHRALADAVPLGPAAGTRGRGRLAGSRHGVPLRRLRRAVHDALGDRVTSWTTLNEPWCSAFLGYGSGDHAPGRHDPSGSLAASHHLLLGHGLAVGAMRAAQPSPQLGLTLNLYAMGRPVATTPTRRRSPHRRADEPLVPRLDAARSLPGRRDRRRRAS